jgi:hypothetical protein
MKFPFTCSAVYAGILAIMLAGTGCHSPAQTSTSEVDAAPPAAVSDVQSVAERSLGARAEIVAHGDLAGNGREQALVVDRAQEGSPRAAELVIKRASIVQKKDGNWSELLRCDEHLKNTDGYLGGAPVARVSVWRLQVVNDGRGLQMEFTPLEQVPAQGIAVRWNARTGRYQSLDRAEGKFLSEVPALDTPSSVLR